VVKDGQFHRRPAMREGRVILAGAEAAVHAA
jgi:hypothetical protein